MIVVLAIDALEYDLVERFGCTHLQQHCYGKTDIGEFSEPRTMVLWTSFMTGRNTEPWVLSVGDRDMWNISLGIEETFFKNFRDPVILDLPGYNYDKPQHARERELLRQYFEQPDPGRKEQIRADYNRHAFEHHRKVKAEFETVLKGGHDFVLGYFSVADVIGHLNFGNTAMMKLIYRDLDEIASKIPAGLLVLSDHGMEPLGPFGDHSGYGFWSTGGADLGTPRITDFPCILLDQYGDPA